MPEVLVHPYCSEQDVRDQLQDKTNLIPADEIIQAINATSRAIDKWCSDYVPQWRRFWKDTTATTKIFDTDDPTLVWTEDFYDRDNLILKTDDDDDGVFETTWSASDYELRPVNADVAPVGETPEPYAFWRIVAVGSKTFPVYLRRSGVQVTTPWGWSGIPDQVRAAARIKAVSLFKRKDAPFGIAGVNEFGPVRITRQDPEVEDKLHGFKKSRSRTLTYRPQSGSMFHRGWAR